MLQLLILWVSTYLISKGVDISLVLRMFKDVAVNVNTKMYKNGNITMYKNGNIIKLA